MKKLVLNLTIGSCVFGSMTASPKDVLRFDPDNFHIDSITMPRGGVVKYKAYEGIYYVTNVEDSAY